ncbi:MAG: ribosome-associated translation inhibitor RaiA [Firmicutes bacterium]|nr:ribosome-associated translation inhibitor RaiA [Bacillota bacterium]
MKTIITGKNYTPSEKLKETIEKKFRKLDKYFSDEITGNVMVIREKSDYKLEATINAKGTIFRSEVKAQDPYDCVDRSIEKLSKQMSKFKSKLQQKYKGQKDLSFAELPEVEEEQDEIRIVKKKKFELIPMSVDEAIVQMELLAHSFYVFLNIESDSVNVVYKRDDGGYGVLETEY